MVKRSTMHNYFEFVDAYLQTYVNFFGKKYLFFN